MGFIKATGISAAFSAGLPVATASAAAIYNAVSGTPMISATQVALVGTSALVGVLPGMALGAAGFESDRGDIGFGGIAGAFLPIAAAFSLANDPEAAKPVAAQPVIQVAAAAEAQPVKIQRDATGKAISANFTP